MSCPFLLLNAILGLLNSTSVQHHVLWDIPLVTLGHVSWLCPLPTSFSFPISLMVGQCEKQKHPWFCVSTPQQQQKHQCVINTVWVTNPTYELLWRKWNLYERKPAHSCKFLEPFGKKCLQLHHLTHMRFLAGYVP